MLFRSCIEHFQENDVYLPIVVLEELDKFKKGSSQLNYNAREFVRELDRLTSSDLFLKGASLGEGKGMLYVVTGDKYQDKIATSFPERVPDHRILSCAYTVGCEHPEMKTILVTKDINMRMKARALGIAVEDYITDKVKNTDLFKDTQDTYENVDPDLIDQLYSSFDGVDASQFDFADTLQPNACLLTQIGRASCRERV